MTTPGARMIFAICLILASALIGLLLFIAGLIVFFIGGLVNNNPAFITSGGQTLFLSLFFLGIAGIVWLSIPPKNSKQR